jgi:predicted XRE-type DNA-binding protein
MFVLASKYARLQKNLDDARDRFIQLNARHVALIKHFEDLTKAFDRLRSQSTIMSHALDHMAKPQFTQAELRTLIQLCHPDKHNGKQSAVAITQKLLQLRGQ